MSKPKRLREAPTLEQLQRELERVRSRSRLRRALCRTLAALVDIGAAAVALSLIHI